MSDMIEVVGIETNNLKNIDVALTKNSINLIVGPSGSGKSSLAYDTIAQIGQHEMASMFDDDTKEPVYKIQAYKNMIATVPIQQVNNNNNIRSTIGTYFGINRSAVLIYSALLGLEEDFFVLNKADNLCPQCCGIGHFRELDVNRIIDYDAPLEKCPIKCWSSYRGFYTEIIKQFCIDEGIDFKKNFRVLTEKERQSILYAESEKKYSIRYQKTGMYSSRTTKYYGVMTGKTMMPKFTPAKKFFSDCTCKNCNGQKYSVKHSEFKLYGFSIGEFMCTPFNYLQNWLDAIHMDKNNSNLKFAISRITRFVQKAVELDLGHLFFHRAIPTLSGGELQRLRLVQVFNTQLSDLLIVLDEPLAGLSGADRLAVYNNIIQLSKCHTMLIVDHHDTFITEAKTIIALGEGSGRNGGYLIDANKYLESQKIFEDYKPFKETKSIPVSLGSFVYKYKGVELEIAENRLNVILGKSGIGKSTLLREYFPQRFEHYDYINQKPLTGNKNSSVATALDIFGYITESFASKFEKDKNFFSNQTGSKGACPSCFGAGNIVYGTDYQIQIKIECRECDGTGFNKILKKYKIDNKSIFDIWFMTIDEASDYYQANNKKLANVLKEASEILLGHLLIGQPTSTLSGGENIRIKILKSLKSKANIYGIDEPFKGLGATEIAVMIRFFDKLLNMKKTIIVADHEEESFRFFTKRIILLNKDNKLIGMEYDDLQPHT